MSNTTGTLADIKEEALRVLEAASAEGIPLRLLGGLAIYFQCPAARALEQLQRTYKDLDFILPGKWSGKGKALLTRLGYTGNKTFNALHGQQRLLFWDEEHGRRVDIFLDQMQMCHTLDFRARLGIGARTLPLADLLLTKLQVVEINQKDMLDALALFYDHEIAPGDRGINATHISQLTSSDWGLYKTITINLQKIRAYALEQGFPPFIVERIDSLASAIETRPKSLVWKARAVVGERVRWYELPEDQE